MTSDYQVCIAGGGLAGLSLALQLKQSCADISIAVFEANAIPENDAAWKVGESSVEIGAHYFAEELGLKDHIEKDQLPKLGLRYFFSTNDNTKIEERTELGSATFWPTPSYQFDRARLERELAKRCKAAGVELYNECPISKVSTSAEQHSIESRVGQKTCRWLIDASGRKFLLKRHKEQETTRSHKASSAWFRVNKRIAIDEWSEDREWSSRVPKGNRWLSTNHLMGEGYWVWLIPLGSGATSIGIVTDEEIHPISTYNSFEKALAWLQKHEPQCADVLQDSPCMDFLALKNYSYMTSKVFYDDRTALTGEAGIFLDPFYSPGSDYIAIANTMICDLILRDHAGESTAARSSIYNDVFMNFAQNTLCVFENQYKQFGNPSVMPLKVMWDFACYWSFIASMYFHKRLCDLSFHAKQRQNFEKVGKLNRKMQDLFAAMNTHSNCAQFSKKIDLNDLPYLKDLNIQLSQETNSVEYGKRFVENIDSLTIFADKISSVLSEGWGTEKNDPFSELTHSL